MVMTTTNAYLPRLRYAVRILLCLGLISWAMSDVLAQEAKTKQKLRRAADHYKAKEYDKAHNDFAEALATDSTSVHAHYGLGNTLYQQGKYEEATRHYQQALGVEEALSPEQTSALLHNLGNIAMRSKQYDQAIECYQKALIQTPSDDKTRYNLVLAQKLKQQQEDKKQDDKQQQQDDKQQNDKQQPKEQPQNNNSSQPNKPQQPPKDEQQPAPPQPQGGSSLTPEHAEQILNAFKQNDERTRKKVEQLQRQQEIERNNQTRRKW